MDVNRQDAAELANGLVSVAGILRDSAPPAGSLGFAGGAAGRDYVSCGDALAAALSGIPNRMVVRADVAESLGCRLRDSATAIADLDRNNADRMRRSSDSI